ncbi:MAG TPA: hypothetical protein VJU86_23335 [Pyrinomonadaceae bacterium]|nr:hypothetical protein [Pyrinomonadaceae bacterium]
MQTTNWLWKYAILTVASFSLIGGITTGTHAQEISESGPVVFFKDQPNIEPSGVLPIGDGSYLLVADDNTRDLLIVEKQSGKILRANLVVRGLNRNADWEAMAKDGADFYLIGSKGPREHFVTGSTKRDFRIVFDAGG